MVIRQERPAASVPGINTNPTMPIANSRTNRMIGARRRLSATRKALLTSPPLQCDLHDEDHHRDYVRQQRAGGQRHDAGHGLRPDRTVRYGRSEHPQQRRGGELKYRDEAGRQMRRTDLGPVTKLEHGRDDVHDKCSEELPDVMVQRIVDLADDEAEVQCRRENDEEGEDDFFEIHDASARAGFGSDSPSGPPFGAGARSLAATRTPWVRRGRRYFFSTMTRPCAFWNTR